MITQQYRPKTLRDIIGQEIVRDTLKAIVKNPEEMPRVIILEGDYGCGKTSSARAFAKALNCIRSEDDACGECEWCQEDITKTMFYSEYDSAIIGNIESIKTLREYFSYDLPNGYKVIVLDEAHLISNTAQAALLKLFEETHSSVFFIMCTTNIDKVLNTIRSRSLVLTVSTVSPELIRESIRTICTVEEIQLNEDIEDLIVKRSKGHIRDAQMLLESYVLLGRESFVKSHMSASRFFELYMIACFEKRKDIVATCIKNLQSYTLKELKEDYEEFTLNLMKCCLRVEQPKSRTMTQIVSKVGSGIVHIFPTLVSQIVMESFSSDYLFQAALWWIYRSEERRVGKECRL